MVESKIGRKEVSEVVETVGKAAQAAAGRGEEVRVRGIDRDGGLYAHLPRRATVVE